MRVVSNKAPSEGKDFLMAYNFFQHDGFNFETQILLGGVRTGCGDTGEILATVASIVDGDSTSWVTAWQETAARTEATANDCAARGHDVSAADAYLRASVYYGAALSAVDGTDDPDTALATIFSAHRRCFTAHVARLERPGHQIEIPYEDTTLPGYFFSAGDGRHSTIILTNGSDGPITTLWPAVGAAALARGYHVVAYDGPGQQSMLFERQEPFRPDWEAVITPIVDYLIARDDVDPERLALYGISQGGYWVPRALAFEHRLAAAVADPGVDDVASSWFDNMGAPEMVQLLNAGDRETFDKLMEIGMADAPELRKVMAWRAKPYGLTGAYDVFKAVEQYRLGDLVRQITTPLLITDPDAEQFWPGQAERLYHGLPGPKKLVRFTAAEGADRHCEPMARALLDQRIFDWLDETIA
jgi:hypothetical protein